MRSQTLLRKLDELDRHGIWLLTTANLLSLFPKETINTVLSALRRQVSAGLVEKVSKGVYANPRARSMPTDRLAALVAYLHQGDLNYVSLESRLSELGVISQIPVGRLTVMTTGRSQTFNTAYGVVEFVHTKKDPELIMPHLVLDKSKGIWVASEALARDDMRRTRRNLHLIGDAGGIAV